MTREESIAERHRGYWLKECGSNAYFARAEACYELARNLSVGDAEYRRFMLQAYWAKSLGLATSGWGTV